MSTEKNDVLFGIVLVEKDGKEDLRMLLISHDDVNCERYASLIRNEFDETFKKLQTRYGITIIFDHLKAHKTAELSSIYEKGFICKLKENRQVYMSYELGVGPITSSMPIKCQITNEAVGMYTLSSGTTRAVGITEVFIDEEWIKLKSPWYVDLHNLEPFAGPIEQNRLYKIFKETM